VTTCAALGTHLKSLIFFSDEAAAMYAPLPG
jgi:hypothetical protein